MVCVCNCWFMSRRPSEFSDTDLGCKTAISKRSTKVINAFESWLLELDVSVAVMGVVDLCVSWNMQF